MTIPLVILLGFLAFGLVRWGKQKVSVRATSSACSGWTSTR